MHKLIHHITWPLIAASSVVDVQHARIVHVPVFLTADFASEFLHVVQKSSCFCKVGSQTEHAYSKCGLIYMDSVSRVHRKMTEECGSCAVQLTVGN